MSTRKLWTAALTVWLVPIMSAVISGPLAAQTPGPRLPFAGLEKLAAAASETVDVSLDPGMLSLAARFIDGNDADQARVKEVLTGLKGIYVRSYEFGADGAFGPADVELIRRQLASPGWSRMAGVRSTRDNANVDVYLWLDGATIGGLGILATEPRRFTVVNIVGAIDLDQLRRLEGYGLPNFDLERDGSKPGKDKPSNKPSKEKPGKEKEKLKDERDH